MNAWRKRVIEALLSAVVAMPMVAQDTLHLSDAVALALANEHGILIARNEAALVREFATPGNSGLLPRIELQGRGTYSDQNTRLDFIEGIQDVERDGVRSTLLSGTLALNWVLFNGMGNFLALERSELDADLADLNTRTQIERTLTQVIALYYAMAGLEQDLLITTRVLEVSLERYQRLEDRAALGGAGRLDVLNALVDLRADSAIYVLSRQRLERTGHDLNVLLGRSPAEPVRASRRITYAEGLDQDQLVLEAMQRNVLLLAAATRLRSAEVDERSARSLMWPRLDLNAGYGVTDQRNEVGVVLGTYNQGLNGGLNLSMPIFDGGRIRTQVESARLRAESAAIAEGQARLQVERDVRNAYVTWAAQREVQRIQGHAVGTARTNFERTSELFYSGQLTGLQFRQAQVDLSEAERRNVVAGFDTKVAELVLLQASGGLLDAVTSGPVEGR